MLDLQYICDNAAMIAENCRNRGVNVDIDAIVQLRRDRGDLISHIDNTRREQNDLSSRIPQEKNPEQKQQLIARGKELRQTVAQKENDLRELEVRLREL